MRRTAEYFNLSIPAPRRLEMMRQDFASHATDYPRCPEYAKPKSWRDMRSTTHKGLHAYHGALSQGFSCSRSGREPVWVTHIPGALFRGEKMGTDHFLADSDGAIIVQGLIARLSHDRWIAGYFCSDNDERCFFGQVFDDEDNARLMANSHALVYADGRFEDSQAYDEANECRDKRDLALRRLRECIALRNKPCMQYVRREIKSLMRTIRDCRRDLTTVYANYAE